MYPETTLIRRSPVASPPHPCLPPTSLPRSPPAFPSRDPLALSPPSPPCATPPPPAPFPPHSLPLQADKSLDLDKLYIANISVNQAMQGRRRTFRAHGRVNPYMSSPCHVEIILKEKADGVMKEASPNVKLSRKMAARMLKTGRKPVGWNA